MHGASTTSCALLVFLRSPQKMGVSIQVLKVAYGDADADAGGIGPILYDDQP